MKFLSDRTWLPAEGGDKDTGEFHNLGGNPEYADASTELTKLFKPGFP